MFCAMFGISRNRGTTIKHHETAQRGGTKQPMELETTPYTLSFNSF